MGFEPTTLGTTIRCSNQLSYIHHLIFAKLIIFLLYHSNSILKILYASTSKNHFYFELFFHQNELFNNIDKLIKNIDKFIRI